MVLFKVISSTVRTCHIVNICPNKKKVAIPPVGVKFWYSQLICFLEWCDLAYLSLCIMLPTLNFLPSVDRKSTTVCWLYQSLLFKILELKENKHDERSCISFALVISETSDLKQIFQIVISFNNPKQKSYTDTPYNDPKLNHKKNFHTTTQGQAAVYDPLKLAVPDFRKLFVLVSPEVLLMVGKDSLQTLCDAGNVSVNHFLLHRFSIFCFSWWISNFGSCSPNLKHKALASQICWGLFLPHFRRMLISVADCLTFWKPNPLIQNEIMYYCRFYINLYLYWISYIFI